MILSWHMKYYNTMAPFGLLKFSWIGRKRCSGWIVVREKYCSGWKNKPNKPDLRQANGARERETYWSRDEYPRKKVPDGVERGRHNCGDLIVWRKAHSHHAIECEVEHSEVHEEKIPEKFGSCPLKPDHCINYYSIYASLNQRIRDFNDNLQGNKLSAYHAQKLKMKKLTVK